MKRLHKGLKVDSYSPPRATWRSGYATVCKTVYTGSIPVVASTFSGCRAIPRPSAGKPCNRQGRFRDRKNRALQAAPALL
jgi:hypothetical protein